ncbi:insulinase family protein [Zhouia sp. PK063]|uniref:M16 family metallopeptidase n=1 Tax=Zhouia sp. PK063 TaxID=3373602 RepID=UPI0037BBFE9F
MPGSHSLEVKLIVKTGLYYEYPHEKEISHLIEHLAFSAGEHFPDWKVHSQKFMSDYGFKQGSIQAYTSNLFTYYPLKVPYTNQKAYKAALTFLADITHLQFTLAKIAQEAGAIEQETLYRGGDNINFTRKKMLASLMDTTQPNNEGFIKHLRGLSLQEVQAFYNREYKAERMVLTIVGDTTGISGIKKELKEVWGALTFPEIKVLVARKKPSHAFQPWSVLTKQAIKGMPDDTTIDWVAYMTDDHKDTLTADQQGFLTKGMLKVIFKRCRLKQLETGFSAPIGDQTYATWYMITSPVKLKEQLQQVWMILEQLKTYGMTQKEWEEVRQEVMKSTNFVGARYWSDQLNNYIVYNEPLPEQKGIRLKEWGEHLSLEQVNRWIKDHLPVKPLARGIIVPEGYKAPKLQQLEKWKREALHTPIPVYQIPDAIKPKPLMSAVEQKRLSPVPFLKVDSLAPGIKVLAWSSGVKVIWYSYKPQGNLKNRVLIHGFSQHGTSCFPDAFFISVSNSPFLADAGGLGSLDAHELKNSLATTGFQKNIRPYIEWDEAGVRVNGTSEDIESMLQYLYLYLTKPAFNASGFAHWKEKEKMYMNHLSATAISEDFNTCIANYLHYPKKYATRTNIEAALKETDWQEAQRAFASLYGNAADLTFIVSGYLSEQKMLPLLQKYIGNLPVTPSLACKNGNAHKSQLPKAVSLKVFKAPYEVKDRKYHWYTIGKTETHMSKKTYMEMVVLSAYLNEKVGDFRFIKGASLYDKKAYAIYDEYWKSFTIHVELACPKEQVSWLNEEVKGLMHQVELGAIDKELLHALVKKLQRSKAHQPLQYSKLQLYNHYKYDQPLVTKEEFHRYIATITPEILQQVYQKYFKKAYRTAFIYTGNQ